jgi:hypothetical protein
MEYPYCESSGNQTASAVIKAAEGQLFGLIVQTDGTNAVTITAYDNPAAASGKQLIPTLVIPTSSIDRQRLIILPVPILARSGIYVSAATAGAVSYVALFK